MHGLLPGLCYECLLSYGNQWDHHLLDRTLVLPTVRALRDLSWQGVESGDHLSRLLERCGSELERRFLRALDERGIRLPDFAQFPFELMPGVDTIADFYYRQGLYVYVDGPHHDSEAQRQKDSEIRDAMLMFGLEPFVIRYDDDWDAKLEELRARLGQVTAGGEASPLGHSLQ